MRIALTGAKGFTGRYVTERLVKGGVTCVPLDADLTDSRAVVRALEDASFDRVIHLAAKAFVGAQDWQSFYAVNQLGTYNLLDGVSKVRPGARVILASSAQVYGPGAKGLIAENAKVNPTNHYAVSKLAMEQGAQIWRQSLDLVITRPFNYTGVGQEKTYLIPKIIDHFQRKAEVIELGNLWVKRDFGDVRALADAYVGLALADMVPAIVNIATGNVSSIDEILHILSGLAGYCPRVEVNPDFVRPNDVPILGGDATLLRKALPNWRPRDVSDTLNWMYRN